MSTSMRAVGVLPDRREVKLLTAPEPRLGSPRDVRVRILEVGVCGTDKEIWIVTSFLGRRPHDAQGAPEWPSWGSDGGFAARR